MAQSYRHFWGPQFSRQFGFNWDIIRHDSVVVITASEGPGYDVPPSPQRFDGNAVFLVGGIAPGDGGVTFWVLMVDPASQQGTPDSPVFCMAPWNGTLNLWTDITVFAPEEFVGQN
jgi:hypothetical protein